MDTLYSTDINRYNIQETTHEQYGMMLRNKTWTGAIGHLQSKKADFALAGLTDTYARRKVIDFSVPYITDTTNFFVGVQKASRSHIFFLDAFQLDVWLIFLATMVLVFMILCFFLRRESISKFRIFTFVFGIPVDQGVIIPSKENPALFVVFLWLSTSVLLTIHYSDALKASTGFFIQNKIDTLDQLVAVLKSGSMSFFIKEHNALIDVIEKLPPSPYGDLLRRVGVVRALRPTDYNDIYLRRTTTAFPRHREEFKMLMEGYPPTKIRAVEEPLTNVNIAIGCRKNFTCTSWFNWVIVALQESGCLLHWHDQLMRPLSIERLKGSESDTAVYIKLADLKSTGVLLLGGLSAALITLLLERFAEAINYSASRVLEKYLTLSSR